MPRQASEFPNRAIQVKCECMSGLWLIGDSLSSAGGRPAQGYARRPFMQPFWRRRQLTENRPSATPALASLFVELVANV